MKLKEEAHHTYYFLYHRKEDRFEGGCGKNAVPKLYKLGNAKAALKYKEKYETFKGEWEIVPVYLSVGQPLLDI